MGVAHDLASRGWRDVILLEKSTLGFETSSRSTKLIHGGLRYLEHPRDFPLVREGLLERKLLIELAPDLVKPIPLLFPVLRKGGMPRFMIKTGLVLYDLLAGGSSIGKHKSLTMEDVYRLAPPLDVSTFKHFYQFYDGQTDDLALVQRVAASARDLGVRLCEHAKTTSIEATAEGFEISLESNGSIRKISTRYIVNAAGPWAHEVLEQGKLTPKYTGINNKGSHIMLRDMGLQVGVFLQSPEDHRIFFMLPWEGKTLVGTTETAFDDKPDNMLTTADDVRYLIDHANRYLVTKISESDVESKFSGLRWLAKDDRAGLSATSRNHIVSEHQVGSGVVYTIYGGKLTAYRALSEQIGDRILKHFGEELASRTKDAKFWNKSDFFGTLPDGASRFLTYK